jgi:biotin synthase
MMGNFLTTLGNTPDEDKSMFSELGLNVAPQPDNGANPRPDNRSGWLAGETPDVVAAALAQDAPPMLDVRMWDPTTQLRFAAKGAVPRRPDGAANSGQGRETREAAARRRAHAG